MSEYKPEHHGEQPNPPATDLRPDDERLWATLAHVGCFPLAWLAIGVIAPIIVLVAFGKRSAYVRHHAVESINFQITMLIALAVSIVLIPFLIGLVLLPLVGIWYVIFVVIGSVRAYRGERYRYPLTLRPVH